MIIVTKWSLAMSVTISVILGLSTTLTAQSSTAADRFGVLVMAHGGTPEWNQSVIKAAHPISAKYPTVVAFGMADPVSLTQALDSLAKLDVTNVAVVRLFVSGRSFLPQTNYLLGLSDIRPDWFMTDDQHSAAQVQPIHHSLRMATHTDGLMNSAFAHLVMVRRVLDLPSDTTPMSVLLVAHGMGQEAENAEVIDEMNKVATVLKTTIRANVKVATLREDWPEDRVLAEQKIRAFAASETAAGRHLVVVPFRLSGFGPYASVMEGFKYTATEGFLPSPLIGEWITFTASQIGCTHGWLPAESCSSGQLHHPPAIVDPS